MHLMAKKQMHGEIIAGERDGDASIHSAFMERMKEGVHRATQFARDTTSSFLSPPRQAHAGDYRARSAWPATQAFCSMLTLEDARNSQRFSTVGGQGSQAINAAGEALERRKSEDKAETSVGLFEMVHRSESDSMASGLEQPCPPPLTQDEWFTFLDSSGPHHPAPDRGFGFRVSGFGFRPLL